eukprot:CAMPEP_0180329134 /NCGR_PEP_ID=MMETSP0988-20121125/40601_2 /TAXON_ID=697907 /ORGANISM="non described non described, Strain CCMP2293" /LENGTH=109 /DNA_ID=CAMNT_0022316221 /DNA_START=102 /DNA_END=428 /DNA_ORIENTATION=-
MPDRIEPPPSSCFFWPGGLAVGSNLSGEKDPEGGRRATRSRAHIAHPHSSVESCRLGRGRITWKIPGGPTRDGCRAAGGLRCMVREQCREVLCWISCTIVATVLPFTLS